MTGDTSCRQLASRLATLHPYQQNRRDIFIPVKIFFVSFEVSVSQYSFAHCCFVIGPVLLGAVSVGKFGGFITRIVWEPAYISL